MGGLDAVSERVILAILPGVIVPAIIRNKGPNCNWLKLAILNNDSMYENYVVSASQEGLWTPDRVKAWTKRFPFAAKFITFENIMKWIGQQGQQDVLDVINTCPGGRSWLSDQIERFKKELF